VVLLCEAIENQRLSVSPKSVQTTSEMLSDREREYIESVMDAPVYNKFGASEVGPVALSCEHSDAMHINTESIIVETDDDGKLYVTNIRNHAIPIVRYQIGDVVELEDSSPQPCDCGATLPRIEAIRGKMNDLVVTTNGTYLDPYFFVDLMDRGPAVETFKIVQHEDRSLEFMMIPETAPDGDEIARHVTDGLAAVDDELPVTVDLVEEVPETEGWKRRYVLSEVDADLAAG
jgi:phenylacetate-CoA ligase